jgi:site-specific recombinase XerD
MDRKRIPTIAQGADDPRAAQRRPAAQAPGRPGRGRRGGLIVIERDGHWHITGTTTVRGRSYSPRKTTGLRATPENKPLAEDVRKRLETEFFELVVYGKKPAKELALAAHQYLGLDENGEKIAGQGKDLGWLDLKILKKTIGEFGLRGLNHITTDEWSDWVRRNTKGNKPRTVHRFWSPVRSFLAWCARPSQGWLASVPEIDLPALPKGNHALRRRVTELSPELLVFLFDQAPIHLRAQVYTQWCTGARVISILFGCRLCDLVLTPGRSQITLHDTKNGDTVSAALHDNVAGVLAEYLDWRGRLNDREGPLFLTDRKKPYSRKSRARGCSSENKTAWRLMKARAVAIRHQLAAETADAEVRERLLAEANLLSQVSPHWLRHWFATHALKAGMDLRAIAEQGGWRDYRSIQRYQHDVPEARQRAVAALPIGKAQGGADLHEVRTQAAEQR